ncbi:MAG: alpha/beta fold hydrolase [Candidatus Thorarchaeota archaeon]
MVIDYEISSSNYNTIDELLDSFRRDVPNFYDEGECEELYIPVDDGELRVFHHKPKNIETKRPIVFVPGFATMPRSWREFHQPHHGYCEYYHIETRDKKSSKIKNHSKVDYTIQQVAKDIGDIIKYLQIDQRDYILMGACMCGGAILTGLINKNFSPPTTIVLDPFCKWTQNRVLVKTIIPILPPTVFEGLKTIFAKVILANMKNETQKERNWDTVDGAVGWIWRKFSMQNVNYDITNDLDKIEEEVFVFHGPPDKYHPEGTFQQIATKIPKGRFYHIDTQDRNREILAGVIGTNFAMNSKNDDSPVLFESYEIPLYR